MDQEYTRLLKQYKKGYISVTIYLNIKNNIKFYDTVVHRRCKNKCGKQNYIRGANLKPNDIEDLIELLIYAKEYLAAML